MRGNDRSMQLAMEREFLHGEPPVIHANGQIPQTEHFRILPPLDPPMNRAMRWILAGISKPTLFQFIVGILNWPFRMLLVGIGTSTKPGPIRAYLAEKVSKTEFFERMKDCESCNVAFRRGKSGNLFCGSCGCGEWFGAALHRKNWSSAWYCPREKHNHDRYPTRNFIASIPEDMRKFVSLTVPNQRQGGCSQRG